MVALRALLLPAVPILLLIAGAPSQAGSAGAPGSAAAPGVVGAGAPTQPAATPADQRQALAVRLSQAGAVFYGAWWCPHCQHQKDLFGTEGSAFLPYVECDRDETGRNRCFKAGIRVYPTWELGGERREGVLSLEELKSWLTSAKPTRP